MLLGPAHRPYRQYAQILSRRQMQRLGLRCGVEAQFHYLGLVLVKRIMERFDGSITLRSEQQVGTTVRLLFRVASGEGNGAEYSCS